MSDQNIIMQNVLKELVQHQYKYEQEALEVAGKIIKTEKDLAKIYKTIIDKEVDESENREDSLT